MSSSQSQLHRAQWPISKLEKHVKIYSGVSPSELSLSECGRYPFVKVEDLNNCTKYQKTSRYYTDTKKGVAPANSVIFPKRGAAIMNNKIRIASVDMAMDTNLMAVMPSGTLETEFFFYAIEKEGLFRIADTSTIPQLNNKHINPYKLRIPPLLEQCRIAEILRTWDEAIDKASQLCTAKGAQYRAIRRSITSVSSNGHSGKDLLRLSEITKRVRRVNDGQDHPVMTISAKSGFILQSDKYSRDMAGTSLENYIVLHRGEFAYNKGNSLTSPQGCIFRLGEEKALVPHVYFCFSLKKCLDEDFFVHLVESGYLNHQLSRVINSGVRNDGLLNLNAPDFFNCRVPVPPVEEQARIADILNGLRSELAILDKQVELLERQKRGLMQKLLTGEWRVTV